MGESLANALGSGFGDELVTTITTSAIDVLSAPLLEAIDAQLGALLIAALGEHHGGVALEPVRSQLIPLFQQQLNLVRSQKLEL